MVSDLDVRAKSEEGERRVILTCEDGGDFPGSLDDLIVQPQLDRGLTTSR
jgi:hypothetical protein